VKSPLPSALDSLLLEFAPAFTAPSFENFAGLLVGWILCVGRRTITNVIRAGDLDRHKGHSAFHRFFSHARWELDALSRILLALVLPLVGDEVHAIVDDTLSHRSGPQIWGGGMHHDAGRSSYRRHASGKNTVTLSFGHSWVVLSVWVPLPWNPKRGLSIPVLWRLYRPKKRCPADAYRKRTELAVDMLKLFDSWLPTHLQVDLVGDREYACSTVLAALPQRVDFAGPVAMDAALFEPADKYAGKGRPRTRGRRLPSPQELADDPDGWTVRSITFYGRAVKLMLKTRRCLWYTVTGTRIITVVVVRDPRRRYDDRAFFATDRALSAADILTAFCRRWAQEVLFRDSKQLLGLEHPQNGWWRRRSGERRPPKQAGPEPHASRGAHAVERTAPFAFVAYALVVIWYFRHGRPDADVARARLHAPWYRHKREPSIADMLAALRRTIWVARLFAGAGRTTVSKKLLTRALPDWLLRAA
jgi:hypothetical protein